ncbi:MAG: hypothetical protein KBS52_01445 [Clostridiales bacterium]|nr:hypothetical protein [Candidatus Equinaster intestinalis]
MKIKHLLPKILSVFMVMVLTLCIVPTFALSGRGDIVRAGSDLSSVNCRVFKMPKNAVRQRLDNNSVISARADNLSASAGKFKYNGYSHLNSVQKHIYDEMVAAANNLNSDPFLVIENTKDIGSIGDIELVFMTVMADRPEIFWLSGYLSIGYDEYTDGSYDFYMVVSYTISDKNELDTKIATLNQKIKTITDAVKGMTDYDKELYFHDYLCKNITFKTDDGECFTSYGALINGSSVCEGYAESMQLLLNACDINCVTVRGTNSDGEGHMWNLVELPTGWHELDVTWDDYYGKTRYNYFNINSSVMEQDHTRSITYTEDNIPDDFGEHLEFNFCSPRAEHEAGNGGGLYGNASCPGSNCEGLKLSFYLDSTGELFSETSLTKSETSYQHKRLPAGKYTVKVSKTGYVERSYDVSLENSDLSLNVQLKRKGDVTGDGKANKSDLVFLKDHVNRIETLSGYDEQVMDLNGDKRVNKSDVGLLKDHINRIELLW